MVFASICEHASSVFIFASTSSCQIFLASSEHFEYFVNFPLAEISLLFKIGYVGLCQVIAKVSGQLAYVQTRLRTNLPTTCQLAYVGDFSS